MNDNKNIWGIYHRKTMKIEGNIVRIEDKGEHVEVVVEVEKEFIKFKWEKIRLGKVELAIKDE